MGEAVRGNYRITLYIYIYLKTDIRPTPCRNSIKYHVDKYILFKVKTEAEGRRLLYLDTFPHDVCTDPQNFVSGCCCRST